MRTWPKGWMSEAAFLPGGSHEEQYLVGAVDDAVDHSVEHGCPSKTA
jgi:hypothetical protein